MRALLPGLRMQHALRPLLSGSFLRLALLTLGFGVVFPTLCAVRVLAQQTCLSGGNVCSQVYLDSLPQPKPMDGDHRVVQLVNCSCQTVLGAANAAHQSGKQGFPVFPREGTWIMQPYGTAGTPDNPNPNVLTIDIPQEWERTQCPNGEHSCPSVNGPRFWARTGCRYDLASQRAQCETGSCADHYDCSSTTIEDGGFTTISEWTFYQGSSDPSVFIDNFDISLVDGSNLNMDIQPIDIPSLGDQEGLCPAGPLKGQMKCNPTAPTDQHWLMYNYPLSVHAADLRSNDPATNQNCTDGNGNSFVIKRSDINKTNGYYGFVIEDANGNPVMPPGDTPLACLSNCGKYEFAGAPAPGCDYKSGNGAQKCYGWLTFCAGEGGLYGTTCKTDADCVVAGNPNIHASCWYNDPSQQKMGTCSLRAFYQTPTQLCPVNLYDFRDPTPGSPASDVACTFTYGSLNPLDTNPSTQLDWSDQPPAAPCTDVIGSNGKQVPCVGDDIIHQVFHGAYTWPNDPETFDADSSLYRVIVAPGGTSVPITQAQNGIPLCSALPSNYNYPQNFNLCAASVLNEGAVFAIARDQGQNWPCAPDQAASASNGVLCRWQPAPTTDSGCSPPLTDQYVTNSSCGVSASGTSLTSSSFNPNNGDPLFIEVAIATPDPTQPIDLPAALSGCVPSSGPGSWTLVNGGSLFFGSQTNQKQGFVAWYSGTSNNDGSKCAVTVTLAESAAASLKIYDVPGYSGTVETTSSASGSFLPSSSAQPSVFAQPAPITTAYQDDLMLGGLLQVDQQLTPITYWQDWLTNTLKYSPPVSINCESNLCPTDDGTDYLSGHGSFSSNADAGHLGVGPGQHALERRGEFVTAFNWGGVAIYIELKATPLALTCPSSSAQVGAPYASPLVPTGGQPDYNYAITSGQLPPGLNLLGLSNPYIYGTPTTANTYPYTAQVTDSAGNKASSNCTITVTQ
jgi:hypothetical protein